MAIVYYPYCETGDIPFYVCDPCGNYEQSKLRSVGFLTENYYTTLITNPTSTAIWQAGIASEDIIIIPLVRGSIDAPDAETAAGFGDATESILARLFSATWFDPNYRDNCNFYNELKNRNGFYHFIYRTASLTHITEEVVTIDVRPLISENDQEFVLWQGSASWRSKRNPCPFDTPDGIFSCFGLQ